MTFIATPNKISLDYSVIKNNLKKSNPQNLDKTVLKSQKSLIQKVCPINPKMKILDKIKLNLSQINIIADELASDQVDC